LKGRLDVLEITQNLYATVLFADSSRYNQALGGLRGEPDRLLDSFESLGSTRGRAVLGAEGRLEKSSETGVAVFGRAADGEGGAARGGPLRADMRRRASGGRELGEAIALTVGINSGDVLAGAWGSRWVRSSKRCRAGETVNRAGEAQGARLRGRVLGGPNDGGGRPPPDEVVFQDSRAESRCRKEPRGGAEAYRVLGLAEDRGTRAAYSISTVRQQLRQCPSPGC
jgi:hypothetical protein